MFVMRWFGVLSVALLLPAVIACGPREDEGFRLIHIADLVAMRTAAETPVTVVDANGPDFRAREGTIPGAILLSSYSKYDTGEELPASKDARLVFYCADPH
jgi:hypothetical protein